MDLAFQRLKKLLEDRCLAFPVKKPELHVGHSLSVIERERRDVGASARVGTKNAHAAFDYCRDGRQCGLIVELNSVGDIVILAHIEFPDETRNKRRI